MKMPDSLEGKKRQNPSQTKNSRCEPGGMTDADTMESTSVRLQKFLADQGIASRRQAEQMIEDGRVTVNGRIAEIGMKITPGKDRVSVDESPIHVAELKSVVLAVHKPRGYLCSNADPHHDRTVFQLVPPNIEVERLFCAGRLDKESEGLLILTNDGAISQRLTHPSHRVIKRYAVTLDQPFQEKHTRNLLSGITWEGERLKVEKVIPKKRGGDIRHLEVHMQHGKKREIRRLFHALGYEVKRLQRFQIGSLHLRGLGLGKCKRLGQHEIEQLFS
jgi:23S rRNA pseudouridine2605 synthase